MVSSHTFAGEELSKHLFTDTQTLRDTTLESRQEPLRVEEDAETEKEKKGQDWRRECGIG